MERNAGNMPPAVTNMAPQECIALADMLQLQLGQKDTDVLDQLTNTDFQGDFFDIGDTVQIVAIDPNSIKVVEGDKDDLRPTLDTIAFSMKTMTIDKQRKYGFRIKDLERLEDRWNHESAAHALAGRQMRTAACLDILNLITGDGNIATIGTPANPLDLTALTDDAAAAKLFRLTNAMLGYLEEKGAIKGKEYQYGTNKTVPLRGTVSCFLAPALHRILLNAQYVREDDIAENVIRDGKYEKFNGMLLNSAPALDNGFPVHVAALDKAGSGVNVGAILIGTKNLVTLAQKVLPPEKFRDHKYFADNYNGREVYGRQIAVREAGIIAYVKFNDEFTVTDPTVAALMPQAEIQAPVREDNGAYPDFGPVPDITGKADKATTLAGYGITDGVTETEFAAHTHTIEAKAIDGTNPVADIVLPVDEETQGE